MNIFSKLIYSSLINESENIVLLPEKGTTEYSAHVEDLINELSTFKKSLRKVLIDTNIEKKLVIYKEL
jgi:hypothetical protein